MKTLTPGYDMRISGDSLITYLPYFGRAYNISIDPNDNGINFTSTDFKYKAEEKKKGWDISISPKDGKSVSQLWLNVSRDGYATLQVTSNNRESISFNGYIKQR